MPQGNSRNKENQKSQTSNEDISRPLVVDRTRLPKRVHARQVASRVARTYQKADARVLSAAKRVVPQKTLHQLAENRSKNKGNIRIDIPVVAKKNKRITLVVPGALSKVRHAVLPLAVIATISAFALVSASSPSYISTKQIGGLGVDTVVQSVRDSGYQDEYIVGTFQGTVDFGADWGETDPKTSAGGTDVYVTRINSDGSYGWTKHFGGSGNDEAAGISISSSGVFVAGNFVGTVDFGTNQGSSVDPKTSAGGTDGFVLYLSFEGNYQWARQFGGTGADTVRSMGNHLVYGALITGSFSDTVDFGADWGETDPKTSAGGTDGFVLSIDESGEYQSTKRFGGAGADTATSAQDMGSDNVRVTGSFSDTVDFGADWGETDPKTSAGGTDGFVLSLLEGGYLGAKQFGSTGDDSGTTLKFSNDWNVYITGSFSDTVDFGADWGETDSKTVSSGLGAFVLRINEDNSYGWARQVGAGGNSVAVADMVVDDDEDIYVGGSYNGTVDFAADAAFGSPDSRPATGVSGGYVTKLSDAGGYEWTRTINATNAPDAASIKTLGLDENKVLSIGGSYNGTVDFAADFNATDEKTAGSQDIFITKIATQVTTRTVGDAEGLTFKDSTGVNLSSTGTSETNPIVYIHNQSDDTLIATIAADLTENRDWSSVSGENDTVEFKSVINDAIGAPGAAGTMTLYVPKDEGDTAVALCPNIETLLEVTADCAGKRTLTGSSEGVTTATVESVEYWVIEGIVDQKIGGMSVDKPKVLVGETDNSTEITEGGATDFVLVRLDTQPSDDVTVQVTADPTGQVVASEPVVFTTINWDTPVLVEIVAADDNDIEGNHSATLGYATSSSDATYDSTNETGIVTVAITDNDTAGVTINAESNLLSEDGTTTQICAQLTARPKHPVTLDFTSNNTSEITIEPSLSIPTNKWNAVDNCVTVTGVDDDEADGPQNVTVRVSGISSDDSDFAGVQTSDIDTLQLTNQDNDTAAFTVSPSGTVTTEAGGSVEICIVLTARPTANVIVPVSVSDPSEATLSSISSLTITPSAWNRDDNCVTVTGVDDYVVDGDIQYDVVTGDPTSTDETWNVLGAIDIADQTLTNTDDDEAGMVIVDGNAVAVAEGGATDTFTVALTSEPAADDRVVIRVAPNPELTVGGEAGAPTTLTFTSENWNQPQAVTVQAVDDNKVEGPHGGSIVVSVDDDTTESSYAGLTSQTIFATITDNDIATATITTVADASEQPETNGRFRVSLDQPNNTGADMAFAYAVSGTAQGDQHYAALSGEVVVADGESTAEIVVSMNGRDNELLEGDRTVIATLTSSDSALAEVGDPAMATVVIFDDERAEISLAATQNGNEENEVAIVYTATLDLANNTGEDITVQLDEDGGTATAGDDYISFNASLVTISDGATAGNATVTVIDDELFEDETETVRAKIDSPSMSNVAIADNGDKTEAMIADNDIAEISLEATTSTANEHPSSNGVVRIGLDKVNHTDSDVQVAYTVSGTATADSDYASLSGNATIQSGQQQVEVMINTEGFDDEDMEGTETAILTHASNNMLSRVSVGSQSNAQVTIIDNETTGITVTATDDTTSEDGGTAQICATLASRPSHPVTILFDSEDSNKVSVPASMTIQRNNWDNASENCLAATGNDDVPAVASGTQNVLIRTIGVESDDPFYELLSGDDVEDVTIRHADNDTAGIVVTSIRANTSENGEKTAAVQFRLQTQPSGNVSIPVSISDETEGLIAESQITVGPEDWDVPQNNEVIIEGVDDYLTDGDITYSLVAGDPVSTDELYNDLGASDIDNVQLINEDDDEAGVVFTNAENVSVSEGDDSAVIDMRLNSQPTEGNTVVVRAVPADVQIDLGKGAGVAKEFEFDNQNWQVEQQLSVAAFDDDLLEGDHGSLITYEIVNNEATESAYNSYIIPTTTTVSIVDNDTATATFNLTDGNETGPAPISAEITLSKENNTGAPITVLLNPNGGTAASDSDYADFTGTTVSIPDGESSAIVSIGVVDDDVLEGDETVQAILSDVNVPFVTLNNPTQAATIIDNDTATTTVVATGPTAYENPAQAGEFTVYLSRTNNTGTPITVTYETAGTATPDSDYTTLAGTATVPTGASSVSIPVTTTGHDDGQVEGNETVIVTLQSTDHSMVDVGGPSSATVTIADDDGFTFNVQKLQDGSEDGEDIVFRVELSQVNTTGNPVTVDISDTSAGSATATEDYQNFGGTVTIPDGQQFSDYSLTAIDDTDLEDIEETVEARISNQSEGEIGIAEATATITDNETAAVIIEKTSDGSENPSSNGVFTISLDTTNRGSQPITMTYTVNGTATAGDDYEPLLGHAMIASGQDSTVITVDTTGYDDGNYEGNETVIVTLGGIDHPNIHVGEPSSATLVIMDDDPDPNDDNESEEPLPGGESSGGTNNPEGTAPVSPRQNIPVKQRVIEQRATEATNQEIDMPKPQPIDQKTKDTDSDGVADDEESRAHNNGDGNGDGIPDNQQSNVASLVSAVTDSPVTLEAGGECSEITKFAIVAEDSLSKRDKRHTYPYGLVDFKIACEEAGQKSMVAVYYDRALSTDNNWRKFSGNSEHFATMDFVQNVRKPVGTSNVTAVQYTITDGEESDSDGKVNSEIVDPAGFAQRAFYVFDFGWIIPLLIAGSFIGYATWHRVRDHRKYR